MSFGFLRAEKKNMIPKNSGCVQYLCRKKSQICSRIERSRLEEEGVVFDRRRGPRASD